nr:MAG TPA: hypothetical protein [Caudoviricetes sp.]
MKLLQVILKPLPQGLCFLYLSAWYFYMIAHNYYFVNSF